MQQVAHQQPRFAHIASTPSDYLATATVQDIQGRINSYSTMFGFTALVTLDLTRTINMYGTRGQDTVQGLQVLIPRYVIDKYLQTQQLIALDHFIKSAFASFEAQPFSPQMQMGQPLEFVNIQCSHVYL